MSLIWLLIVVPLVAGSEFPERECCDPSGGGSETMGSSIVDLDVHYEVTDPIGSHRHHHHHPPMEGSGSSSLDLDQLLNNLFPEFIPELSSDFGLYPTTPPVTPGSLFFSKFLSMDDDGSIRKVMA